MKAVLIGKYKGKPIYDKPGTWEMDHSILDKFVSKFEKAVKKYNLDMEEGDWTDEEDERNYVFSGSYKNLQEFHKSVFGEYDNPEDPMIHQSSVTAKIKAKYKVVMSGPGAGVEVEFDGDIPWKKKGDKVVFSPVNVEVTFRSYYNTKSSEGPGLKLVCEPLTGEEAAQWFGRMGYSSEEEGTIDLKGKKLEDPEAIHRPLILSGGYSRAKYETGDTFDFSIVADSDYNIWVPGTATFLEAGQYAWEDLDVIDADNEDEENTEVWD